MQPISTQGWTFDDLLAKGSRFKPAPRVSCTSQNLEEEIQQYEDGLPLVIEGWHQSSHWPQNIFSVDFCRQYFLDHNKKISARNVHTRLDKKMRFDDFIEESRAVSTFAAAEETERWYGKDVECPEEWEHWLHNSGVLPQKLVPDGSNNLFALRPKKDGRLDIETLMCYFGVADTYTSCHKDLCASSGHNLMCYTEQNGSSFWFMTKGSDCSKVTQYFHTLKQELDHESHTISIPELARAPFDVYIVEQKLGDLVLVPPRSCHQVINSGGLTIKMSWSRMTLPGLTTGLYHELPLYRRVCRPETYQIKSTVYYTLRHYTQKLEAMAAQPFDSLQQNLVTRDLTTILRLYDQILVEEFSPLGDLTHSKNSRTYSRGTLPESETQLSQLADVHHTCDFCGADIFQSYFQCTGASAKRDGEKGFMVCPGCYVEGRTCACEVMEQMQCQNFDVLFAARWDALQVLKDIGSSLKSFEGSESLREQKRHFAQPSDSSIFHAAMLLHHLRTNQRQYLRPCRNRQGPHSVPSVWALGCKKCHAAKCFPHLLESRMHSMQAFLLQAQDQSHAVYHKKHTDGFPEYPNRKEALLVAQEEGKPCTEFGALMVFNALKFRICQPVNATHAKHGWYDKVPPKGKRIKSEQSASKPDESRKGPAASDTIRSSASPQASAKNHAYVEVKRVRRRPIIDSPTTASDQFSSSPLSSVSQEDIDALDLFPQHFDSRKESPTLSLSHAPITNTTKAAASQSSRSVKMHGSHRDQSGDGTIFATVYPIGPPRKRKRQEMASKSKDGNEERPKPKEPDAFAAALGAAINQVAETATEMSRSAAGARQRLENLKKRPRENAPAPTTASNTRARRPGEDHIVVNVTELQDLVIQTAERTVRRIVGETASSSPLTTKTAVSMITEYAAAGTFVNGNTQLQFPSLKHFAEVSPAVNRNQGASTSYPLEKKRPLPPHSEGGTSAAKKRRMKREDESEYEE